MKSFLLVMMLFLSLSCSKQQQLKDVFINGNDYWACYDELNPGFYSVYYKFKTNGKSDRYCDTEGKMEVCYGSDVVESNVNWEVTNDSILKWGAASYNVVTCNESAIVLYSRGEIRRHKFLIKEYPGKLRERKVYFENKAQSNDRLTHPSPAPYKHYSR